MPHSSLFIVGLKSRAAFGVENSLQVNLIRSPDLFSCHGFFITGAACWQSNCPRSMTAILLSWTPCGSTIAAHCFTVFIYACIVESGTRSRKWQIPRSRCVMNECSGLAWRHQNGCFETVSYSNHTRIFTVGYTCKDSLHILLISTCHLDALGGWL